jgi:hypothetical protein
MVPSPLLPGHATPAGTARYRDRFPNLRDASHFRQAEHVPGVSQLWLSSIGLGTYLGEPSDAADQAYTAAIEAGLHSGINVLDTAINYRHQRSERNIGTALKRLVEAGELHRDEVLVCTKAGYLSFDGDPPADPRGYFHREYVETGVLNAKDLAGGMHCMSPAYLENQIERSRRNLGLETIDRFYIHNPESQLAEVSREVFRERLKDAFAALEKLAKTGKIQYYGVATWSAFRAWPRARAITWICSIWQKSRMKWQESIITSDSFSSLSTWRCRKLTAWSTSGTKKKRCRCYRRRRVWESRSWAAPPSIRRG